MNEKKFYLAGIIVPAVCFLADTLFGSVIVSLVMAIICLILNLKKRSTHRIAIGVTLSCLLFLGFVTSIGIMIFDLSMQGDIYQQEGILTEILLQHLLGIPASY